MDKREFTAYKDLEDALWKAANNASGERTEQSRFEALMYAYEAGRLHAALYLQPDKKNFEIRSLAAGWWLDNRVKKFLPEQESE